MSTIVAVRKDGKLTLAAETLTKVGYLRIGARHVVNHSKLVQVGRGWVGAVGHASWDLILRDYLEQQTSVPALDTAGRIFAFARKFHEVLKERYHVNPNEEKNDPFESSQFELILANPGGLFGLCALRSVLEFSSFHAVGTGADLALGAMHAVYDLAAGSEDVARAGLAAAIAFDDSSGGPIELRTVELDPPE